MGRRVYLLFCFAAALYFVNGASEWLQFRGDANHASRVSSPLGQGRTQALQHGWTVDLRPRISYYESSLLAGTSSASIATADAGSTTNVKLRWGVDASAPSFKARSADLVSSQAGLETVICDDLFTNSNSFACSMKSASGATLWTYSPHGQLYSPAILFDDYNGDGTKDVIIVNWEYVGIVDATTGNELTRVYWKNNTCSSGRQYGWIESSQLNYDSYREVVIAADFQNSIEMIGNSNTTVVYYPPTWEMQYNLQYGRCIEHATHGKTTEHHVPRRPLRDLLGVGYNVLTTNIFNEMGDERWHVQVRDYNGTLLLDLANSYCRGFADVNGDGAVDLLVIDSASHVIPRDSIARVYSLRNGQLSQLFAQPNADFAQVNGPAFTETQAIVGASAIGGLNNMLEAAVSSAAFPSGSALDSGNVAIFLQSIEAELPAGQGYSVNVSVWQWNSGSLRMVGSAIGPNLKVESVSSSNRGFLLSTSLPGSGASAATVQSVGMQTTMVASALEADKFNMAAQVAKSGCSPSSTTCASEILNVWTGTSSGVYKFPLPNAGNSGLLSTQGVTRYHGWGMYSGEQRSVGAPRFGTSSGGIVLARLLVESAEKFAVFEAEDSAGSAVIRAVWQNGTELWSTAITIQSGWTQWNKNGVTLWQAVPLLQPDADDILVHMRYSSANSDRILALHGRNGTIAWQRMDGGPYLLASETRGGAGGALMPAFDMNSDGNNDLVSAHPSVYAAISGVNGAFLYTRPLASWWGTNLLSTQFTIHDALFSGSDLVAATASLVPRSPLNYSNADIFISDGSNHASGACDKNSTYLWRDDTLQASQLPIAARMDGSGITYLYTNGLCNSNGNSVVRLTNGQTGQTVWSLTIPSANCNQDGSGIVVDWDSDGVDEFVFATTTTGFFGTQSVSVFCIGSTGTEGVVLWSSSLVRGGATAGPIALVVQNSAPVVILGNEDGFVYGFDTVGAARNEYIRFLALVIALPVGGAIVAIVAIVVSIKCCSCCGASASSAAAATAAEAGGKKDSENDIEEDQVIIHEKQDVVIEDLDNPDSQIQHAEEDSPAPADDSAEGEAPLQPDAAEDEANEQETEVAQQDDAEQDRQESANESNASLVLQDADETTQLN
eukprot:TRINITY_DN10682_c0_g2_i1.p1 TRINITY_DN10682_c0_g2~~TRINITY_DN10682_c0_g2_i1.p1  ORF type:complete len:1121 (-),score=243.53 TRINITY_DN10682_c0_g2_i1:55-3417(-)